jgi:ABC-2 type transport system permease protein
MGLKLNKIQSNKQRDIYQFALVFVTVISLVVLSYFLNIKVDVTEDNRFTLKQETKDLLSEINDIITVKIYLEGENLPVDFIRLKNSVKEMLDEFGDYADETIQYEFIDLNEIKSKEKRIKEIDRLAKIGIQYMPVEFNRETGTSTFEIVPGAEFIMGERVVGVNLLKNNPMLHYQQNFNASIETLEYELSLAIRKLVSGRPKNVAFLQGHGESNRAELQDLAKELSNFYITGPIVLWDKEGLLDIKALDFIDLLIISKPLDKFEKDELFLIDQYVLRGGKLLCMLEGSRAHIDSLRTSNFFPAMPHETELEDLLFHYGVRIDKNLIQDIRCAKIPLQVANQGSMAQPELAPWVFFPIIFPEDNDENGHVINTRLNPMKLEFASSLFPLQNNSSVQSTVLLKTSGKNRFITTPTRIGFEEAAGGVNPAVFIDTARAVAVLMEGKFDSYFKNRPVDKEWLEIALFDVKRKGYESQILVISDGDFGVNPVLKDGQILPLGADRYNRNVFYDNKRFLINAVDYMLDNAFLIPVRSKKIEMRLLDKKKLKEEELEIKVFNFIVPIVLVLLISLVFFIVRKKRFS